MRSDREPGGAYAFPDDPQYAGSGMRLRYGIPALSGGKGGAGCSSQRCVCVKRAGLKRHSAIHARTIAEAGRLDGRDYLAIQATSVGLFPDSEKAAVEDSAFYEKVGTGYDLIYRPAETKFMRLVKENGKEAYNGLKMLLYQGVEAFELWNDVAVSKETADRIYQRMEQELSGK